MVYFLGDIGRTKTRLAISRDGQTFEQATSQPTPTSFEQGLALIKKFVKQFAIDSEKLNGLCLGVSRQVWPDSPLKLESERIFGGPVYLENDAALAGLGEARVGAGRGCRLVVYVTVSTGVGGVKIENGRIGENVWGFEPGQQIIMLGEAAGQAQTLENLVSGAAVERRFNQAPHNITDEKIWQDLSRYLAIGLANTLLHWSPDCLVLGGGMFNPPGFRLETVVDLLKQQLTIFPQLPAVRLATLGEWNGLHGALIYLQQKRQLNF